jgi:hypothetical protein
MAFAIPSEPKIAVQIAICALNLRIGLSQPMTWTIYQPFLLGDKHEQQTRFRARSA